ncbi:hypothetical protein JHK82_025882 [Glycine max]|nr:hypothetical protein JHK82_025882 [Glycine max]
MSQGGKKVMVVTNLQRDKRRLSNFVLISYKLLLREIVITTLCLIMIYENKNI